MVWNIFTHSGHSDKVLCCDWSSSEVLNILIQPLKSFDIIGLLNQFSKVVASGGADNDMKIFKASSGEVVKPRDTWCQGLKTLTFWSWSSVLTNTGTSTVQIHSFRAYKQNIRTALTIFFKSLFSVSYRLNKMVADGENVDPVVKKIIWKVHWKLKTAFLIYFSRWNIISATSTYRGTSSFRKRPSPTTAGWILFFFYSVYILNITLLQCSHFTALLRIILCLGYHGDHVEVQAAIWVIQGNLVCS